MAGLINHRHVTAIADSGADVDSDEWNDSLVVSGGSHGQFMRRDTGGPADGWSLSSLVAGDIPDLSATYQPLITTLAVNKGGTGIASYAVGDLLYASGATALSKLADVAVGSVLVSGGVTTAPSWSANPAVTSITLGTNPPVVGAIRLSNNNFIEGRTTGGTDVHMLSINPSDNINFGSASASTAIRTQGNAPTLGNNGWFWVETNDGTITGNSAALMSRFNSVTRLLAPSLRAIGRAVAQNAAVASLSTFTVGAADASFEISANVLVTTATTHSFTVTCAYTDEGNTARTVTLNFFTIAGTTTITNTIANAAGAVPYLGIPIPIRAKAATAITVATTGTFTTVTYNAEGIIQQVA